MLWDHELFCDFLQEWTTSAQNLLSQGVVWARKKMSVGVEGLKQGFCVPEEAGRRYLPAHWMHFTLTSLSNNRGKLQGVKPKPNSCRQCWCFKKKLSFKISSFPPPLFASVGFCFSDHVFNLIPSTFPPTLVFLQGIHFDYCPHEIPDPSFWVPWTGHSGFFCPLLDSEDQ